MWNWVQGAFLGLPVSGITELTTAPFLRVSEFGAKQITGGDYGIEGGIACDDCDSFFNDFDLVFALLKTVGRNAGFNERRKSRPRQRKTNLRRQLITLKIFSV